jgi:hypothetical protein
MALRFYSVTFENVTISNSSGDYDLFEITPASNKAVAFCGLVIGQNSIVADANEKMLRYSIIRVPATATSGSGGSAPTPRLISATGGAAGFTAETANGTVATTSGTLERLHSDQFNARAGLQFFPPPELWCEFVNGTFGVVRLEAGAGVDITGMSATLYVQESG